MVRKWKVVGKIDKKDRDLSSYINSGEIRVVNFLKEAVGTTWSVSLPYFTDAINRIKIF